MADTRGITREIDFRFKASGLQELESAVEKTGKIISSAEVFDKGVILNFVPKTDELDAVLARLGNIKDKPIDVVLNIDPQKRVDAFIENLTKGTNTIIQNLGTTGDILSGKIQDIDGTFQKIILYAGKVNAELSKIGGGTANKSITVPVTAGRLTQASTDEAINAEKARIEGGGKVIRVPVQPGRILQGDLDKARADAQDYANRNLKISIPCTTGHVNEPAVKAYVQGVRNVVAKEQPVLIPAELDVKTTTQTNAKNKKASSVPGMTVSVAVKPNNIAKEDLEAVRSKAQSYATRSMKISIPCTTGKVNEPAVKAYVQGVRNVVSKEKPVLIATELDIKAAVATRIEKLADVAGIAASAFADLRQTTLNFVSDSEQPLSRIRELLKEIASYAKEVSSLKISIDRNTTTTTTTAASKKSGAKSGGGSEETEKQQLARLKKQEALLTKLRGYQDRLAKMDVNKYLDTSKIDGYARAAETIQSALSSLESGHLPVKELQQIDISVTDVGRQLKNIEGQAKALTNEAKQQEKLLGNLGKFQQRIDAISSNQYVDTSSLGGYANVVEKIRNIQAELSSGAVDGGRLAQIAQEMSVIDGELKSVETQTKAITKEAQDAERAAERAANKTGKNLANLLNVVGRFVQSDPMFKVSDSVLKEHFLGTDEEYQRLADARDEILKLQQQIAALEGELSDDEMKRWLDQFAKLRNELLSASRRTDKTPLFGQEFAFLDKEAVDKAVKGYEEVQKEILKRNSIFKPKQLQWKIVEEGDVAKLTASFVDQTGKLKTLSYEYDNASGKLKNLNKTEQQGLSFMERMNRIFKQRGEALVAYLGTFASFYRVIGTFREGAEIIKALDTNMTELRRVSGATESALQSFKSTVFETGREVGTTADNIIKLAADYARLGYTLSEASELAKSTAMYMNVGFIDDANFAMESLTSTMKAYGMQASEVSSIVDRFNEVGKLLPMNGYIGQRVGTPETELRTNMLPRCA